MPAGSSEFPSMVRVTLVIGVIELAAKSAAPKPVRSLLTVPNSVAPLKKSSLTGNVPSKASGSASNPKVLKGLEKSKVTDVVVRKSTGDRTRGVLVSTVGGEPQFDQVVGTVNSCIRAENVTVRKASDRVSVVSPSIPIIGIRVVEPVYAASGSGICVNPAPFAAGIQRSKAAKTVILE